MKKIASFTVNHLNLDSGVYVSREDCFGEEIITTFDLRITRPNKEPVMNTAEIHTIEHLGATFLRNHQKFSQEIVYFGPMGCRTGFYMVIHGKYSSLEILPLIKEMFDFIKNYEGDVPGASARDCGNYLDLNLNFAKFWATRYLETLNNITPQQLVYQP